jgi:hypothetical protein
MTYVRVLKVGVEEEDGGGPYDESAAGRYVGVTEVTAIARINPSSL